MNPTKRHGDNKKLPRLKGDQHALERPLPFRMGHLLNKFTGSFGGGLVEPVRERGVFLPQQIVKMTVAGLPHVATGRDFSGNNISGVLVSLVGVDVCHGS